MVKLSGLEPTTSPISGERPVQMHKLWNGTTPAIWSVLLQERLFTLRGPAGTLEHPQYSRYTQCRKARLIAKRHKNPAQSGAGAIV